MFTLMFARILTIFCTVFFVSSGFSVSQENHVAHPQKGLPNSYATRSIASDKIFLLPIKPSDAELLLPIFTSQESMKYFGLGKTQTIEEVKKRNFDLAHRTLLNQFSFGWTLYTHDGIVGRINIFKSDNAMELAFCVLPNQKGKGLARRGSECIIDFMREDVTWIATAHPLNIASIKTLEAIQRQDGTFVFFKDLDRQCEEKYGQVRNYYMSKITIF